jgi:hypothetical protein
LICQYCDEPVLPGEAVPDLVNMQDVHRECAVRMIVGSAAHQLGECTCHGGVREDPPGVTLREAARLAYDTFMTLRSAHAGTD